MGCLSDDILQPTMKLQMLVGELLNRYESNYIQANRNKFQFCFIFDKSNSNVTVAITSNTVLNTLDSFNPLGIQVVQLSRSCHLQQGRQAGRQADERLARLFKNLSIKGKLTIFQTFTVCHFNFCPIV